MVFGIGFDNTFASEIISSDFYSNYWRKTPRVFKAAVNQKILENIDFDKFYSWCKYPVTSRLFIRTEESAPGTAKAGILPDLEEIPEIAKYFMKNGEQFTILLNHVERVDNSIRKIRSDLGIDRPWRYDDIVATLSTKGAGIGFHAGHEDGFIIQLQGKREWKLWAKNILPTEYIRSIQGDGINSMALPPMRPTVDPILTCHLDTGDVLYIPPFVGHEGITIEDSISIAIGWKGLTPFTLLMSMRKKIPNEIYMDIKRHPEFFELIPDPPQDANVVEFIMEKLFKSLRKIQSNTFTKEEVGAFLHDLFDNKVK